MNVAVTYDELQAAARLVSWICCRRTVYATHPERGCYRCRGRWWDLRRPVEAEVAVHA